jgi:ribosomal-protein-alanine N-acetyltransferase
MLKHKGTKIIETSKLFLRRFNQYDLDDMFEWSSDPEVAEFPYWSAHTNIEFTKKLLSSWISLYEKEDYYNWAIESKEYGKAIGGLSIVSYRKDDERCEVAYCMNKTMWGNGFATEALEGVIQFLINEVGFERVEASHDVNNVASGKVMIKSGMKYEGTKRNFHKNKDGNFVDCDFYAILSQDIDKASESL